MKITFDVRGRSIVVLQDGKTIHEFTNYQNTKSCITWVYGMGLSLPISGEHYRAFAAFKKLQYKVFVVPHIDIIRKISWNKYKMDNLLLESVHKNYSTLKEAYSDGLFNVLPIIAITGKSPKELKESIPNWKIIAKNSLNKNKVLMSAYLSNTRCGSSFKFLNEYCYLPTTVLKNNYDVDIVVLKWISLHCKGKWGKLFYEEKQIFTDTLNLFRLLGRDTERLYKLSYRRIKEEHDICSKEYNKRRFSNEEINCLKSLTSTYFQGENSFEAHLLKSPLAIAEEGMTMHHCVASYIPQVENGRYLVYSITQNGERHSTLGISVSDAKCVFNQHFMKYNKVVENPYAKMFVIEIVNKLNRTSKI